MESGKRSIIVDAYVARQPVFNRRKKIFGYELLFRDETARYVPEINGDVATSTVLGNSFFTIGMDNLLNGKKSFINFTQNLLLKKVPLLLPREGMVVEILESVEPTPELVQACREMSQKGCIIALDDFEYKPELDPLIELADILKFDFRLTDPRVIEKYLTKIPRRKGLSLLAEKVETHDEFKIAKEMGFDYFQGFFFCKPELVKGKDISGSQLNLLQIMAEVNKPDFNFINLEKLIAPDVNLSFKLLRYINSAFFAKAKDISSIQQALVYMGEMEIRRFVSLIAMTNLAKGKPEELIRASCIRGKFCEMLGSLTTVPGLASELFTLGMFSLIDAILDQPMDKLMDELPLSSRLKNALVHRKGELVGFLALAEYYEQAIWPFVSKLATALNIAETHLPSLYLQACEWANTVSESE
jgi:EAL and modified HD-GYP domain-containing signal transduction protein